MDGVGPGFVADFKTDREVAPERHALRLLAYAKALDRGAAYIAYLRHDRVERITPERIRQASQQADALIGGIRAGAFEAHADEARCAGCAYQGGCGDAFV